jgi:hypothetical protein
MKERPMTYRGLRSRALWGGALLTGLLLAAPAPARAEAETKANSQGLDKVVGRVKQAIGEAAENGKIAFPVERALKKLLRALDEEEREHRHLRHHQDEGTFGAGFEQAGAPSKSSNGSTGNSGSGGDSQGDSTGSGASPDQTDSPMTGGTGNSPNSTPSNTKSKSTNSPNKQPQGQEPHRGGHNPFAQGLRHAEHEWRERREERMERRLEHAFVRGLTALRRAEEHSEGTEAKPPLSAKGSMGSKASNSSKTASATPSTDPGKTVNTNPKTAERHEQAWGADDKKHPKSAEMPWKMAAGHAANGGKGGPAGVSGHSVGLMGQHPSTAHAPTGSAGHASTGQHAGALAGTKHSWHKK